MKKPEPTLREKIEDAPREPETDDDPDRFREPVWELVRHKPSMRLPGSMHLPKTPLLIHDDSSLEAEADLMGARAMGDKPVEEPE